MLPVDGLAFTVGVLDELNAISANGRGFAARSRAW
jgi:hypothetical protein